jgi:poly(A) polymerase
MKQNASKSNFFFPFSPQLKILFNHLLKDGTELRVVGGAVRDFLVNKKISDIDLACKYLPQETAAILEKHNVKTIATGIKYGTITAIIDSEQFQITTLRKDTKSFGRDCEVEFVDDFYQDALRRDFTINAMSIDFSGNLYDYFDGKKDLENKIVKFIGDADIRIKEDYLRILRFFRFSSSYGSIIDSAGLKACIDNKEQITTLSSERIRDEFFKILSCKNRDNLWLVLSQMHKVGILSLILQNEGNLNRLKNLFELEKILDYQFQELILLASLSCDSKISLSKAEKKHLQAITNPNLKIDFKSSQKNILGLLLDFDQKTIDNILIIQLISNDNIQILIDDFLRIRKIISTAKIPEFQVDGYDLIEIGIAPKNIGKVLKIAKKYWLDADFTPSKAQIINFISTNKS